MIVAFLQNPYFSPGASPTLIAKYRDRQDFHRRVLAGSMTGKRLIAAFGEMYEKIHWDNANWRHVTYASGKMPADLEHIDRVLFIKQPDLVIAFGKVAADALTLICIGSKYKFKIIMCPHPSAFGNTSGNLTMLARTIKESYSHLL